MISFLIYRFRVFQNPDLCPSLEPDQPVPRTDRSDYVPSLQLPKPESSMAHSRLGSICGSIYGDDDGDDVPVTSACK